MQHNAANLVSLIHLAMGTQEMCSGIMKEFNSHNTLNHIHAAKALVARLK